MKEAEKKYNEVKKKYDAEKEKYNEQTKGTTIILLGSVISTDPLIVSSTGLFGNSSYYWVSSGQSNVSYGFGVVYAAYLKPTGYYSTYNDGYYTYTCAEATAVEVTASTEKYLKDLEKYQDIYSTAKGKISTLKKSFKDTPILYKCPESVDLSKGSFSLKKYLRWKKYTGSYQTVKWFSSNKKVAKINQNGVLELCNEGTTKVTVKSQISGKEKTYELTIYDGEKERLKKQQEKEAKEQERLQKKRAEEIKEIDELVEEYGSEQNLHLAASPTAYGFDLCPEEELDIEWRDDDTTSYLYRFETYYYSDIYYSDFKSCEITLYDDYDKNVIKIETENDNKNGTIYPVGIGNTKITFKIKCNYVLSSGEDYSVERECSYYVKIDTRENFRQNKDIDDDDYYYDYDYDYDDE
ncbi:MAG: hypothetical protein K5929_04735 [Lachnospiraceae bacterium]|nr:hypothetical protein [Lachnospiraceae bacterium]